jgi:hypothetical protein
VGRQTGINKQLALLAAMNRQQKRQGCHRRNQFTHQPGGFIAVKEFVRDLQVGAGQHLASQRFLQTGANVADIARLILPRQTQG